MTGKRPTSEKSAMTAMSAAACLAELQRIRAEFGPGWGARKLALLARLDRVRLVSASAVEELHDLLIFCRAYPDDAALLAQVESMLAGFDRRSDLRRHRAALADTGIAGTAIDFPFFAETAWRLAERFPASLEIDWSSVEAPDRLERWLPFVAHPAEVPGLDEIAWTPDEWLDRMRGESTGGAFFLRRLRRAIPDPHLFERVVDDLGLFYRLTPSPPEASLPTPSRTRERLPGVRAHFQTTPLLRGRPDLGLELGRGGLAPLAVEELSGRRAERMLAMARDAMVTRSRDLDAFAYGSAEDVRLITWEDGLQFAVIGVRPDRRLLLEAVYAFLTLKNGVPAGYVLNSALFGSAEIAFNVFEAFRGVEAARVYARVLATVKEVFGASAFTIFPYQLGDGNDEALDSGAWWFYQKLGFRPRAQEAVTLMNRELARQRRDPASRSSRATLARLAQENLFLHLGRERREVIGEVPLPSVGVAATALLSRRFGGPSGADDRGEAACAAEARALLGLGGLAGWSADERDALQRWAPVVLLLPGIGRWSAAERRALGAVIRAKGGRRESEYVRRFDAHPKLPAALARLARRSESL
ncbi:MAG: hypothetical protein KBA72_02810 [Thermoanaerobaculia bacterium]|jgi:hypothetical protein|nr:hypothetical protein [Thermoanaerobaculia bacterium]